MKAGTEDQVKGKFHEVKGNPKLAGKAQERLGQIEKLFEK